MTRPDYVSEELWERAHDLNVDILFADTNEDELRAIALTLLQARNDALREAAGVAYVRFGPDYGTLGQNGGVAEDSDGLPLPGSPYDRGKYDAAKSILSLIQEPS